MHTFLVCLIFAKGERHKNKKLAKKRDYDGDKTIATCLLNRKMAIDMPATRKLATIVYVTILSGVITCAIANHTIATTRAQRA